MAQVEVETVKPTPYCKESNISQMEPSAGFVVPYIVMETWQSVKPNTACGIGVVSGSKSCGRVCILLCWRLQGPDWRVCLSDRRDCWPNTDFLYPHLFFGEECPPR